MERKVKRYGVFDDGQQKSYNHLTERQQKYIDFRGQGMSKADSYRLAGFNSSKPSQAAYHLEQDPIIADLIDTLLGSHRAKQVFKPDAIELQAIKKRAKEDLPEGDYKEIILPTAELPKIEEMDAENARRLLFYRSIYNGEIKTVKKTTRIDKNGEVIDTKIEEIDDVVTRINARKEIDRILGMNMAAVTAIGNIQAGNITINIVDASKKDTKVSKCIDLEPEDVQVIDGKEVVVVDG